MSVNLSRGRIVEREPADSAGASIERGWGAMLSQGKKRLEATERLKIHRIS